jgi:hypothetical protein
MPSVNPNPLFPFLSFGMGHPEQALSDMRRCDARSAQIGSAESIGEDFHRSAYSGEPSKSILARNLLSKDRCRAALGDETPSFRP